MKFKLRHPDNPFESVQEHIILGRNVPPEKVPTFLSDIGVKNNYDDFGLNNLHDAAEKLASAIFQNKKVLVIVDSDCDGYTSSAILINYLYRIAPVWTQSNLEYFLHSGKQHGLNDSYKKAIAEDFSLVIVPDAGSNDYTEHEILNSHFIDVIILDHHEAPQVSKYATVINNQLSDYPNKFLSGAGVVWQFCRYFDKINNSNYADEFLDLVALGNCADMMDMRSPETAGLINEGFREENLKNPFVKGIREKNAYSLGQQITPMGAAFYISPFVNAIVRSGTIEEKTLVFNSMLEFKANEEILSTKRGHSLGEKETIVSQALRVVTNVKNRQSKKEQEGMAFVEGQIEKNNLMSNQVLLFTIHEGEIDRNIIGLVANRIMSKYQRPVCILNETKHYNNDTVEKSNTYEVWYEGSARGCNAADVANFKDICEQTGVIEYAAGHQGAFGLGIKAENIDAFIKSTNEILKDMPNEPVYYVDYIWENEVKADVIQEIASTFEMLWGTGFEESYVGIQNLKIPVAAATLMKRGTFKIELPGISLIKFNMPETEYWKLTAERTEIVLNIYGKPDLNTWNGHTYPQLIISEYELVNINEVSNLGLYF